MNIWIIIDKIKMFPREVKWFIQRGRRGYADCDWWEIGYYISKIMPPMLHKMVKEGNGYPGFIDKDDVEGFHEESRKKWEDLILQISKGFEDWNEWENERQYSDKFHDKDGNFLAEKYQDEYNKVREKLQESGNLLGEFLPYLWD